LKEVTDTFIRTSDHLRYLTTIDEEGDTQTIETTDGHPFWVVTDNPDLERAAGEFVIENGTILYHENLAVTEHGYYVEAKDLRVGDVFTGANGELTTLTDTHREEFPNGVTVYNFTVADNHNYYVIANLEAYENGASVVLVHNASGVYTLTDKNETVLRTGRTNDLARREVEHNRQYASEYHFNIIYETDDYATMRGLEQYLYEQHLDSATLNKIKAISDSNPNKAKYIHAAEDCLRNH
jgi:hypothetical protein